MKSLIVTIIILFNAVIASVSAGDITIPPMTERKLSNGLDITLVENHELPVVYIKLVVEAGSIRDPKGKEGLSNFTVNMLKRGTASRSAEDIADEIDFVGGKMDVAADKDDAEISIELLAKHIDVGISILSDLILNPTFDSSEIEKYRNQVINGIIQSKDDPRQVCEDNFDRLLFGNHPYAHPAVGYSESVKKINKKDIKGFYEDYFRPNNSFMVIAGDINPDEIFSKLESSLNSWSPKAVSGLTVSTPSVPDGRRILLIDKPGAAQTHIIFGTIGITRKSDYYYPFTVMNYILGAGVSFVNRLMTEVRAKGGLTYDIRTINDFNILPGAFYCASSTENDSTLKAIELAMSIMDDMAKSEVTEEEYNQAIGFYSGYYPISLETPKQWAREIARVKLYDLPDSYIEDFVKNIKAVKRDDIIKVADYLIDTDNLLICVVSNAADVKSDLEKLGKVTVVELDDL